jgi:hypothetical protein
LHGDRPSGQKIAVFLTDDVFIVRFGINDDGVDSWDDVIRGVAAKARRALDHRRRP